MDDAGGLTEAAEIIGDVVLHPGAPWEGEHDHGTWGLLSGACSAWGSHAGLVLRTLMEAAEDECTAGWFYRDRGKRESKRVREKERD